MNAARILIACEFSGTVRRAFTAAEAERIAA